MKQSIIDALVDLLDRPIAFHRPFVVITGSVTAALFLSQAWYWSKRTKDSEGWFYKTQAEWQEETGLSRREQETARKSLISLGFLTEKLSGVPATLHFKVNLETILDKLVCTKAPNQYGGNRQTRMAESAKLSLKEQETTTETTPKITPLSPKGEAVDLEALVSSEAPALVQHLPAIREWLAYKKEKKQAYKPLGLKSLLRTLTQRLNPSEAILHSMAMNYSGVYDKPSGGGEISARGSAPPKPPTLRTATAEQLERMRR